MMLLFYANEHPPTTMLGTVSPIPGDPAVICRDTAAARWWARPVSRWLAAREARALQTLAGERGVPRLLGWDGHALRRSSIPGVTMQEARPADLAYFRQALRLLARLHRHGVAHNDLAREPNWLVTPAGEPALIDFQLAWVDRQRGRVFRLMAREDLRHLLKHKRYYCPQQLSARQRRLLDSPSLAARIWRVTFLPLGRWFRRRVKG
jgi:RIO-like serine/threonine protein kinase